MQFITRFVESIVARIVTPIIEVAVERTRSSLADRLHTLSLEFQQTLDTKAESFTLDEVAGAIPMSQVVGCIDIDTIIEGVADRVDEDCIAAKVAEDISIEAEDVAKHLDFSASDVAEEMEIDYSDLAGTICYSSLKDELDMEELAGHICGGDVADSLDLEKLANKIDYRQLALALIEVAAAAKATPVA